MAQCSRGAVARNANATSVSTERLLHDTGEDLKKSPLAEKHTKEDVCPLLSRWRQLSEHSEAQMGKRQF